MLLKENGKVRCQECGKMYSMITPTHLKKKHKMTLSEYKEKFPDAPITAEAFNALSNYSSKDEETPELVVEEPSIESTLTPKSEPEVVIIEEPEVIIITQIDKVQPAPEPEEELQPEPVYSDKADDEVLKTKSEVYEWLRFYFNDLKQGRKIEKTHFFDGALLYSYYADFVEFKKKINFQFVKYGWHQGDMRPFSRNQELRADGWNVIVIEEVPIKIEALKEILKNLN